MFYAYDIFWCVEEGTATLSVYKIEKSHITSIRRMRCTKDLSELLFQLDQKGKQGVLQRLYGEEGYERAVDWERTYVKVNGVHEYNLAVEAYKELTGMKVALIGLGMERYNGYVGIDDASIISYSNLLFVTSEIPLTKLLKAAKMKTKPDVQQ